MATQAATAGGLRPVHPWGKRRCSSRPLRTGILTHQRAARLQVAASSSKGAAAEQEPDVVVIGSGLGGLCCAAVLAYSGVKVTVCESHTTAGGVAHSFKRGGYEFDSGPSFYLGLSDPKGQSTNSLKNVLDLLDEPLPCATYDRWTMYLPEGQFDCIVDPDVYASQLEKFAGAEGVAQWRALEAQLQPLADFAGGIPFGAIRTDPWVALSMMKYLPSVPGRATELFRACGGLESMVGQLEGPFSDMVEDAGVTQPFVKKMLDLESFVISGTLASGMPAPEMAYMYAERHKKGAVLDYPVGGSQAYIDALVRGIEKYGGTVQLGSHVEEVVVEDGRAVGVRIRNRAEVLRAKQAVVANLSVWDLPKLLKGPVASELQSAASQVPECESFLHLHAGLDATGLPPPEELGIHHLVVRDWELGVDGPLNIINISIPTALDPSLAPPGKHTVHVYGAANESFDTWAGLDRSSPEYAALKEERGQVLWDALERVIPDARKRAEVEMIGSPLTHARFNRRHRGSYGPAYPPGDWPFPGPGKQPGLPECLIACGDSTFPGIGVPSAAASGVIAANSLLPIWKHLKLLDKMLATS